MFTRFVAAALVLGSALSVTSALATESRPLFRLDGFDFSESDLQASQRQAIHDAYAQYLNAVNAIISDAAAEQHVRDEAKKAGREVLAVRDELVPAPTVSDAEVTQFYRQNQQRIRAPLEQVRTQIVDFLKRQKASQNVRKLAGQLIAEGRLELLLPPAEPPTVEIDVAGLPTKGPEDAPVTLVEFADFQCPHCKRAHPVVDALLERFEGKLRVVYMHLPLNQSGISRKVAIGSVCAERQGRFWPYHDLAFELQSSLNENSPASLAKASGLDMAKFEACYASAEASQPVVQSESEAERLGVSATPTMFVNGQRVRVTRDLGGDLRRAIEKALEAS